MQFLAEAFCGGFCFLFPFRRAIPKLQLLWGRENRLLWRERDARRRPGVKGQSQTISFPRNFILIPDFSIRGATFWFRLQIYSPRIASPSRLPSTTPKFTKCCKVAMMRDETLGRDKRAIYPIIFDPRVNRIKIMA